MRRHKKPPKFWNKEAIMVYFIIIILSLSIGGFLFGSNEPVHSERYKDHILIFDNNWWRLKENNNARFHYLPHVLENFSVDNTVIDRLKTSKMIYTTFNPNAEDISSIELVRLELREEFPVNFNIYVVDGIAEEDENYNLPIVTCENATMFVPVMSFVNNNNTGIMIKDNCITIEAQEEDIIMLKDRLVYGMLGVLE